MNEQILERDRYDQMSRHAQRVLMRIGSSWNFLAGPSGSYVHDGAFKTLVDSDEPLTIHAICKSDGRGRNGVKYEIIPMLKKFELVEVTEGRHTSYKLNELGKEVIAAMVETCSYCCESRICPTCYGVGTTHECGHWDYTGAARPVQLYVNDCKGCNDDGMRFCGNCKGDGICKGCLEDDHG